MSFKAALINNVYVLIWQTPESKDVSRILREVQVGAKDNMGTLIYVAISPADSPPPDKDTRGELVALAEQLVKNCNGVHMVFEATGFKAAIKRNVMTGIMLASRKLSSIKIHRSQEDFFEMIKEQADLEQLQARMSELGLKH